MKNKRLTIILLSVAFLLFIPLIAMQFTNEVNWNIFDFMVAGVLLLTTGLAIELVLRKVKKVNMRIVISIIILLMFILLWAELAVGIFGSTISGS